jgi:DNA-binding NtrC family response regulator
MKENHFLPASKTTVAPQPDKARPAHRILVVDKDRDLRQLYAEALAGPGCHVDVVEDDAAGWAALQAKKYSLLITEHEIHKLTGIELVRKLRAAHMALPVVLATGQFPAHELAQDPSLQVAAMLVKPFPVEALVDTVRTVLGASDHVHEQMSAEDNRQGKPAAGIDLI